MKIRTLGLFVLLAVAALPLLRADVTFGSIFTDHAVLQRGKPIPVWGSAAPGEKVTVSYRDASVSTVANARGQWRVDLPAQSVGPASELVAVAANRVALQDVLIGDVWLCSGQSNMAFTVEKADHAAESIAGSTNHAIRHFRVAPAASEAAADHVKGAWQVADPATTGKFTAVGYFFAREIQRETGVPVGLLHASVGGTPIEAWMALDTLADLPETLAAGLAEAMSPDKKAVRWKSMPGVLYNGMISPLLPYGLSGFLWYQGEANANAADPRSARHYGANFKAMITGWRRQFGQGNVPFYFVQLPNFKSTKPSSDSVIWPVVREGQRQALTLPATGMAVIIDSGDPNDIHPRNKQVVGHRLALIALRHAYGMPVESAGPTVVKQRMGGGGIVLEFDQRLVLKPDNAGTFEIAGVDGRFVPGFPTAKGQTLSVGSPAVAHPVFIRYAWSNNPSAVLFGEGGLPVAPFSIDLSRLPPPSRTDP